MLETKKAVMNKSHMINASSEKFTIKCILQKHFEKSLNINLSILFKAPITQRHLSQSTDFTLILKNFLPENLFMYSTLILFFPLTQLLPDSPHLTVHFVSCLKKKKEIKTDKLRKRISIQQKYLNKTKSTQKCGVFCIGQLFLGMGPALAWGRCTQ